jgi:hypothetical protein
MAKPEDVIREAVADVNDICNNSEPTRDEIAAIVELVFEALQAQKDGKDVPDSRAMTLPPARWARMGIN